MTELQKKCLVCQKPFYPYPMGEKNGYKFTACKSCGSVMAEPFPSQAFLDKYFGDIQPEIVHAPVPQAEISEATKAIKKVAGENCKGRRFLDVSCRQGYGVLAAKELGFQAYGIDPHDFFITFAKDKYDPHLFEYITVQDYAKKGGQAEFIYITEAFCEQPDPETYMAALSKILAPGGVIYLHEPDGNHLRLPTNFTNWGFVDPPLNFLYLSKRGTTALLDRHGLKIQKSFFTWSPFMRLIIVRK